MRRLIRRLMQTIFWSHRPAYTDVSDELHKERELRRGMVGDAGG